MRTHEQWAGMIHIVTDMLSLWITDSGGKAVRLMPGLVWLKPSCVVAAVSKKTTSVGIHYVPTLIHKYISKHSRICIFTLYLLVFGFLDSCLFLHLWLHFCRLNQWNSISFFCKCMSAIIFLCFVACLCIYICILLSLSKWNGIQANQPRQLCGQPASTLLTCRRANPFFLLLFNVFGVFLVVAVIGCCRYCFFFFFKGLNSAVAYQNWHISGMMPACDIDSIHKEKFVVVLFGPLWLSGSL